MDFFNYGIGKDKTFVLFVASHRFRAASSMPVASLDVKFLTGLAPDIDSPHLGISSFPGSIARFFDCPKQSRMKPVYSALRRRCIRSAMAVWTGLRSKSTS